MRDQEKYETHRMNAIRFLWKRKGWGLETAKRFTDKAIAVKIAEDAKTTDDLKKAVIMLAEMIR